MKKTTFILIFAFISIFVSAQPHSGLKTSASFNSTNLNTVNELKEMRTVRKTEGMAWEAGYTFSVPLKKSFSFQIEPALGVTPVKTETFSSNSPQPQISEESGLHGSIHLLISRHLTNNFFVQAGPRADYIFLNSNRKKDLNFEITGGLLKNFGWVNVFARYAYGITDAYGSSYFSEKEVNTIEGYGHRIELGLTIPLSGN